MDCYLAIGASTAGAGNYASIYANSLVSPFQTPTYPLTLAPGVAYAFNASLVNGNTIGQTAIGYNTIAVAYTNYKVLHYRIRVTVQPSASSDTTHLVVFPIGQEEIPSATGAFVNTRVLSSQPYARSRICAYGAETGSNSITFSSDVADSLEIRRSAWLDYLPTAVANQPAAGYRCFLGVFLQQLDGAANVAQIPVRIELDQVVEFTDLINPIS